MLPKVDRIPSSLCINRKFSSFQVTRNEWDFSRTNKVPIKSPITEIFHELQTLKDKTCKRMVDQCSLTDTDKMFSLVTCWGRRPGVDLPARMLEILTGMPSIALKADDILKIWPPPSMILPSITFGSMLNVVLYKYVAFKYGDRRRLWWIFRSTRGLPTNTKLQDLV